MLCKLHSKQKIYPSICQSLVAFLTLSPSEIKYLTIRLTAMISQAQLHYLNVSCRHQRRV